MNQVSNLLKAVFLVITMLTIWQFYSAGKRSKLILVSLSLWAIFQLILGITDFYQNENTRPPRFLLLVLPPMLLITVLFVTKKGRAFMDSFDIRKLTLLHTVRVLVEIVLYFLLAAKVIPQMMTFEGRNFDILSGLSALIIYYFAFIKRKASNLLLVFWNLLCLVLLVNVVVIAILSAKTPFQQFNFEQPNIAIAYFPFNWLPGVVVPIVLLSHLIAIRQLFLNIREKGLGSPFP